MMLRNVQRKHAKLAEEVARPRAGMEPHVGQDDWVMKYRTYRHKYQVVALGQQVTPVFNILNSNAFILDEQVVGQMGTFRQQRDMGVGGVGGVEVGVLADLTQQEFDALLEFHQPFMLDALYTHKLVMEEVPHGVMNLHRDAMRYVLRLMHLYPGNKSYTLLLMYPFWCLQVKQGMGRTRKQLQHVEERVAKRIVLFINGKHEQLQQDAVELHDANMAHQVRHQATAEEARDEMTGKEKATALRNAMASRVEHLVAEGELSKAMKFLTSAGASNATVAMAQVIDVINKKIRSRVEAFDWKGVLKQESVCCCMHRWRSW
jgi:hypothetical protein